ncbi:hypothetical protein [Thalassobacillus devorans]|uniref:hypothetical protein n=1 Tax=Thalassobacillus devorans TaxID=279813 RepID=UPI000A1CDA89|nr:hypothetical protein [Thalassobacillus devorans]
MKRIHAYFQNEDQAEGVRAKLQALRADNILVEEMPDDNHEMIGILKSVFSPREDGDKYPMQVLTADIAEEDYDRVVAIVHDNHGHIEK